MAPTPRKSCFTLECAAKMFIVLVAVLGILSFVCVLFLITFSTPVLKLLISAVSVVLLIVSALGWKMVNMSFAPVVHPPNPVLLRAYAFDFTNFPPQSFRASPTQNDVSFSIPRPLVSPDPRGPPRRLAPPPPPPTYDLSETVASTTAPPPYSANGILRRTSSNSPPPQYNNQTSINSPRPDRARHVIIDCSKAVPSFFSITGSESVI